MTGKKAIIEVREDKLQIMRDAAQCANCGSAMIHCWDDVQWVGPQQYGLTWSVCLQCHCVGLADWEATGLIVERRPIQHERGE